MCRHVLWLWEGSWSKMLRLFGRSGIVARPTVDNARPLSDRVRPPPSADPTVRNQSCHILSLLKVTGLGGLLLLTM